MDYNKITGHFNVDKYQFHSFQKDERYGRVWDIQYAETTTSLIVRVAISVITEKKIPSASLSATLTFTIADKEPELCLKDRIELIKDVMARTDRSLQEHIFEDAGDIVPYDFPSEPEILGSLVRVDETSLN